MRKTANFWQTFVFTIIIFSSLQVKLVGWQSWRLPETNTLVNNLPPRLQWNNNSGYCGEVCLISAGLYYGQYISQYEARAIACKNALQNKGQLLLGVNDKYAASQMRLNSVVWDTEDKQNTDAFLSWVKQNVVKDYPVAIGVYTNEYLFYGDRDPNAGDAEYDHIVLVKGMSSNHQLSDFNYYGDDFIYFCDNGLWGNSKNPLYNFTYSFDAFQANREQANGKHASVYSLSDESKNYGIAITGVMDINGDTVPVRLDTNINYELPEIKDGSNTRPAAIPISLTITVSNLESNETYNLYKYDNLESVPISCFNANASKATQSWQFKSCSSATYVMSQQISSNEIAVFRAVKASAP